MNQGYYQYGDYGRNPNDGLMNLQLRKSYGQIGASVINNRDTRAIKNDPLDALSREIEEFDRQFNALNSQPKSMSR